MRILSYEVYQWNQDSDFIFYMFVSKDNLKWCYVFVVSPAYYFIIFQKVVFYLALYTEEVNLQTFVMI